jgi:hypothetical protein
MDLLSQYTRQVRGLARPDAEGVALRFHFHAKENNLLKLL